MTQTTYQKSLNELDNALKYLSTNPLASPNIWVRKLQEIAGNKQRFQNKTKRPRGLKIAREFRKLSPRDFSSGYFSQVYYTALKVARSARSRNDRFLSHFFGELMVTAALKRLATLDIPLPRPIPRQLELFPKKTS